MSFSFLIITISSVNQWSSLPIGSTAFWWAIYFIILFAFVKAKKAYYDIRNDSYILPIKLLLIWNIISVFRGFFEANDYWQWKNLVGAAMVLLLPLSIYMSTNKDLLQKIINNWVKYALPGFFFFLPLLFADGVGQWLAPVGFLLLFFPVMKKNWKIALFLISLFVVFYDLSARSNIIKFFVPLLISFIYYTPKVLCFKLLGLGRVIFLVLPFFLFFLGSSGLFNVFKLDSYIDGDFSVTSSYQEKKVETTLTADTRTEVYEEVISSARKNDHLLLGRTPARGYESEWFYGFSLFTTGKAETERFASEVSILNIFMWNGIIGVIFYFLVFYRATRLALYQSNNIIIKIIGLAVAFRWSYAWVEDFSRFDLSYLFLWIMIGMCFSKSFREMDDKEIQTWVTGIFEKRYRDVSYSLINDQDQNINDERKT